MGKIFSTKKRIFLLPLMAFLFLSLTMDRMHSKTSFSQDSQKKGLAYNIEVSAISLAVTVKNRAGKYVNSLTIDDFCIYENEKKKDITYFSHDFDAPLSLTVLLDVSGSMALQDKLEESKRALQYLVLSLLDSHDEFSLLIFADGDVEVALRFSKNKMAFLNILENTEAFGQTALNDAVAVSPEFANKGNNEKRALLLITDGIENDSQFSKDQAVEIARRVDIPIYTVGYKIPLSEQFLQEYKRSPSLTPTGIVEALKKFSEATGGKAFFINQVNGLKTALRMIIKELSHQYILGYTSYIDPKNEFRKIKVVTPKKRYMIRSREGYYSGEKKDF